MLNKRGQTQERIYFMIPLYKVPTQAKQIADGGQAFQAEGGTGTRYLWHK